MNMAMYREIDESVDPNDTNYGLPSLTSSPSVESYANSGIPAGHHTFNDAHFSMGPSFNTISPSSLDLYHAAHNESCLPREAFFSPYQPENDGFQHPEPFNGYFQDPFPAMGLRYGLNPGARPSQQTFGSQLLAGNNFNAADLGTSQFPASDDCASVGCSDASCQSDCCSTQICQREACSGEGTPCDDRQCIPEVADGYGHNWGANMPAGQRWDSSMEPEMNLSLHGQPCNHTNTEHDVAITLRDLRAPGAINVPQQQQPLPCDFLTTSSRWSTPISQVPTPDCSYSGVPDTTSLDSAASSEETAEPPAVNPLACQWKLTAEESGAQQRVCGHVFSDSTSLHEHICNDHVSLLNSKTKYACAWDGCSRPAGQGFPSRNKLSRHIATHSAYKPHQCETCGESFSAQQALDQHVRTHTGEAPYACEICGKRFRQKSAHTMHYRTHTGEKPLKCEICGKGFCESSNLSKHRKTHNPNPKYECDEPGCTSKFIRIDQLRRHKLRHGHDKKKKQARGARTATPSTPLMTPPAMSPEAATPQQGPQSQLMNSMNSLSLQQALPV